DHVADLFRLEDALPRHHAALGEAGLDRVLDLRVGLGLPPRGVVEVARRVAGGQELDAARAVLLVTRNTVLFENRLALGRIASERRNARSLGGRRVGGKGQGSARDLALSEPGAGAREGQGEKRGDGGGAGESRSHEGLRSGRRVPQREQGMKGLRQLVTPWTRVVFGGG